MQIRFLSLELEKGIALEFYFITVLNISVSILPLLKIGAIAVRLNFRLTSSELEYALNDSQMKILCFHSNLSEQLEPVLNQVSVERFICLENNQDTIPIWSAPWSILENGSIDEVKVNHIKLNDPVMLMYTSGTTGRPKGAICTHDTTYWFSAIQALKWKFTGREIGMTTGPLYHVGAMEDIALPILMMGGTVIITKSQGFEIGRILSVMEHENVTDCFLFPFMIYEMLNSPELDKYQLKALKTIYTGGDPLMPWALEQLKIKFPHLGVVQVYGLTEGQPIAAALDPEDAFTKGHTVGKPMPLTEINIIDDDGMPLELLGKLVKLLLKVQGFQRDIGGSLRLPWKHLWTVGVKQEIWEYSMKMDTYRLQAEKKT